MNMHLEVSNLISYDITKCLPDWEIPNTLWPYHRLYWVYSGEVIYESDEEQFYLEKNTFYVFPIYKKYKMLHNPLVPLHCLWFHVNLNRTILNPTVKFCVDQASTRFYLLKVLENLVMEKVDICNIISVLNVLVLNIANTEQLKFSSNLRMDKVMEYMQINFYKNPTNTQLASLLNLDSRYFIRFFKKNYGQTPQEYVSAYKAFQAATLILQGVLVKDVAEKMGYLDPKAFSRFFKAHKGVSPSEYKKSYYLQP